VNPVGIINASPITATIGGKEWTFHPLTLSDLGQFRTWLESAPIRRVQLCMDGMEPQAKQFLLAKAYEESRQLALEMSDNQACNQLSTFSGLSYAMWLSVRKGRPGVTLDDMSGLLAFGNLPELGAIIGRVSGLDPTTGPQSQTAAGAVAGNPAGSASIAT